MANHRKVKQDNETNESSKLVHVIGAKRGKTHAGKTRLVLVQLETNFGLFRTLT